MYLRRDQVKRLKKIGCEIEPFRINNKIKLNTEGGALYVIRLSNYSNLYIEKDGWMSVNIQKEQFVWKFTWKSPLLDVSGKMLGLTKECGQWDNV